VIEIVIKLNSHKKLITRSVTILCNYYNYFILLFISYFSSNFLISPKFHMSDKIYSKSKPKHDCVYNSSL